VLDEKPITTTIIGGALSIAAVQMINMKPSGKAAGA